MTTTHHRGYNIYPTSGPAPVSLSWTYCHEDYDGAPDSGDSRFGHRSSEADCIEAIDEEIEDQLDVDRLRDDQIERRRDA